MCPTGSARGSPTAQPRSSGLLQRVQRSRLAELASSERIITGMAVGAGGFVYPRISTWREHWAPHVPGLSARIRLQLDGLHEAWRSYISSRFSANAAAAYCRRYFSLLKLSLAYEDPKFLPLAACAPELREHLASHRLTDIVAADVTDRARMQLGSLLCVARKEEAAHLPGRRIW